QGLIDGINGMIQNAKNAAKKVMDAIANFFPHSPAKEGPFSGRGWTTFSGAAMGEGLAEGMESSVERVRASARAMMSAASNGLGPSASLLGDIELNNASGQSGAGSKTVNLTVNNPVTEPASETIRRQSQLIGAALV